MEQICDFDNHTKPYCDFGVFVILCCPNQNTYFYFPLDSQTVKTQVCHCFASRKLTLCACQWKLKVTSGLFLVLWLQRVSFLRRISSPNVRVERRSSRLFLLIGSSTAQHTDVACLLWALISHVVWVIFFKCAVYFFTENFWISKKILLHILRWPIRHSSVFLFCQMSLNLTDQEWKRME